MYADTNTQFLPDLVELTGPRKNKHYKNELIPGQNKVSIIWDFRQMRIEPVAYTIVSCYCKEPGCEPKSWEIQGSDDMENWVQIHKVTNNDDLVGRYIKKTFYCDKTKNSFRYLKYVQLGNHYKNTIVHLNGFEFFGSLYQIPNELKKKE